MLINLDNVSLRFGDRPILENVSLTVSREDRVGLVGANGTGKTTLLNCIAGVLTPDSGSVFRAKDARLGYLRQSGGLDGNGTVRSQAESIFSSVLALQNKIGAAEEKMASLSGSEYAEAAGEYSRLRDEFEAADGFSVPVKINTVLTGMGFSGMENQPVSTLSGGEKTRLALACLLLRAPDVLLLDEPTNHLDLKTLMWLEDYLADYSGAVVVVSHDRYFLDKRCSRIWELEDCRVTAYRGNYSDYKLQKAERVKAALRAYEKETARAASMLDYAQKNIARASTSAMAKSRLRQLEHMELPEKPREHAPVPRFAFSSLSPSAARVLDAEGLSVTVGDPPVTLVPELSFSVRRGDRVAVIGSNGVGKTSLLRRLYSALKVPDPSVVWGRGVSVSFFEQENDSFIKENTVLQELWRHRPGASPQELRDRLGNMLFSGDAVFKTVSVLSGGEKARLAFAVLAEERSNVLLLDEPTNHLDLPAREALEKAVSEYDGTVIFVSHDRYFINSLATKVLELSPSGGSMSEGGFDSFVALRAAAEASKNPPVEKKPGNGADSYHRSKQQRSLDAKRKARVAKLEELIAECEKEMDDAKRRLSEPDTASDYEEADRLCRLIEDKQRECDVYMTEWVSLAQ